MNRLILSAFLLSFAAHASTVATNDNAPVTPEENQRLETLDKAWKGADIETFINNATNDELTQLIQGTIVDGTAERLEGAQPQKFKHVFVVNLNHNRKGQSMTWYDNGRARTTVKVSGAGIKGKITPRGTFVVHTMDRNAWSRKFKSPMPCALFFHRGGTFAIHGTTHSGLGSPASNGCVRVAPKEICPVFDEIRARGEGGSVLVRIQDSSAAGFALAE